MSDRNYTCVANAMQSSKIKPSIKLDDKFTNYQGSSFHIIQYINANKILIEFDDEYKHQMITRTERIKSGIIKNPFAPSVYGVGYIGVGEFSVIENGKKTQEYGIWHAMIQRCYDDKFQERNPAYKGCTVSSDWLNFQIFAKWYTSQEYSNKGYQIDKDILKHGNKIYSKDNCCLVPKEINSLFTGIDSYSDKYPKGVCYHKATKKYIAALGNGKAKKYIGVFKTVDDALQAYSAAKKQRIKELAIKWQGEIDSNVFDALMQRTI